MAGRRDLEVSVNGRVLRGEAEPRMTLAACLLLAVQAEGHELTTVEGLAAADGTLHPIQEAFSEHHGLQCGFCTPGFLMSVCELLADNPSPAEGEIREHLSGNLCRCTGYQNIVEAVQAAARHLREAPAEGGRAR